MATIQRVTRSSAATHPRQVTLLGLRSRLARALLYVILTLGAIACLLPFFWMISMSLKGAERIFTYPPELLPRPAHWENYLEVVNFLPVTRMLFNSVFVTAAVLMGQLTFCSMAGYSFARLRFPGREAIFLLYLATLMVPYMVILVPSFVIIRLLGWLNTYQALIIPGFFGGAYGTFLMRQFFMTIPQELADAATIDGCDALGTFWRVFLPLTKPAMATLGVFTFIAVWNDFLWPMVVTHSQVMRTLTVGVAFFGSLYGVRYNLLMAGTTIGVIPTIIVFLVAQRYFVEGVTVSGLKA